MRLKSHESPRNRGRNNKSPKRSARTRQLRKARNMFLQSIDKKNKSEGGLTNSPFSFILIRYSTEMNGIQTNTETMVSRSYQECR
jgi:hypothetical protein